MFWSKLHRIENQKIIAICDKDLIGKKLEIDLKKSFFCDKEIDEKKAIELLFKSDIGNLFGKKIIDLATRKGLIDSKNILLIGGVPHAQYIRQ